MSILITTPTGHIGGRALKQLLEAGAEVSVIVRRPDKLSEATRRRVKVYQGSLTDAGLVAEAFRAARAVLWLTPPDITHPDAEEYHREMGRVAATAIKESKNPHVVNISSAGAQLDNAGPVSGLGAIERRLNEVAENVIHLRPGFFMDNYLSDVESIKRDGAVYSLVPGDLPFPMIATQDIGDVAAELLLEAGWGGQSVRGLHGPEDLTFAGAARILSDSIGRPVEHIQITPDQATQAFLGFGASPGFAKALVDMYQALARPGALADPRTRQTTTPTTLGEWSDANLRPLFAG